RANISATPFAGNVHGRQTIAPDYPSCSLSPQGRGFAFGAKGGETIGARAAQRDRLWRSSRAPLGGWRNRTKRRARLPALELIGWPFLHMRSPCRVGVSPIQQGRWVQADRGHSC